MAVQHFLACCLALSWLALISATQEQVAEANNMFAFSLYDEIREDSSNDDANIFISPFSIHTALSMTSLGASGTTLSQMQDTLVPGLTDPHQDYQGIIESANSEGQNYTLSVANRLFGEQTHEFLDTFTDQAEQYYHAGLQEVDFINNHEAARVTINDWVEEHTENKIQDLMPQGSIDAGTILVLVNAVYFKGFWKVPFDEENTQEGTFHGTDGDVQLDMMQIGGAAFQHVTYTSDDQLDCSVLKLPYSGDDINMYIVLPNAQDGLTALEDDSDFSYTTLNTIFGQLPDATDVIVKLPKFKIDAKLTLNTYLQNLGMVDAFDSSVADFSALSAAQDIQITSVIHQAYLAVDETGTEAAGATGITIEATSVGEPPEEFVVDHPFLVFIRNDANNMILFMGRVTQPEANEGGSSGPGENQESSEETDSSVSVHASLTTVISLVAMVISRLF